MLLVQPVLLVPVELERLEPVDHHDQVHQDLLVQEPDVRAVFPADHLVPVLAEEHQVALRVPEALVVQAVDQVRVVVAELAAELQVLLVRAALAVKVKLVNQSVLNVKNLNSAPMHLLWVARLCHVVMAPQYLDFVADLQFKILPTRLTPQLVN
jgi:hypothetical protein